MNRQDFKRILFLNVLIEIAKRMKKKMRNLESRLKAKI